MRPSATGSHAWNDLSLPLPQTFIITCNDLSGLVATGRLKHLVEVQGLAANFVLSPLKLSCAPGSRNPRRGCC